METLDEYGNVDRGIFRGITSGKPTGTVSERADKAVIDGGSVVAHLPVTSLRSIKRIPGGTTQFERRAR